jgi:hypothetical protein
MLAVAALAPMAAAASAPLITVYKTPSCGCCHDWISHLQKNGFEVLAHDVPDTSPYRSKLGVPKELASCHTGVIDGYALEGHVPAEEIKKLLVEKPKARGLSVPGMVVGSPGMETDGTRRDAFDVVLFDDAGLRKVYKHYAARS